MAESTLRRAAFLDRDGVIIDDKGYLRSADQVELLPGATEGLRALRSLGYLLVVASNQAGVGRGYFTRQDAAAVHERMVELLRAERISLDGAYYCFHGPDDGCDCRKPAPGSFLRATEELGIDVASSLTIGDRRRDLAAGRAAGCPITVMLGEGYEGDEEALRSFELGDVASFCAKSWPELIAWLKESET